jgi:3-oxosteroid 1-dehydrogenase
VGDWDREADFVVVGAGSAGLTGAATAAALGLDVLVLEKADVLGGQTALAGGGVWIPMNPHMEEAGATDSREQALAYARACARVEAGAVGDELIVTLIDRGPELIEFLEQQVGLRFRPWPPGGTTIDYRPWLPGAKLGGRTLDPGRIEFEELGEWAPRIRVGAQSLSAVDKLVQYAKRTHTLPPATGGAPAGAVTAYSAGSALIGRLLQGALAGGAEVLTEAPASELVLDDGRVVGVRAVRAGRDLCVRARHGVLLATGGFGGNRGLLERWLPCPPEHVLEPETNEGDGHLMAAAAGARLGDFDGWWMPVLKSGGTVVGTRVERVLPHTMIVNAAGARFMDEAVNYYDAGAAFGTTDGARRNTPAWLLFDRQGREKYAPLAALAPAAEAATVEELAGRLGIEPDALATSVHRFNGFARDGRDPDFGRGGNVWDTTWGDPEHRPNPSLGPLEAPPFHAVELRLGALATRGGVVIDTAARAVGDDGPIAGLYAAGSCTNGSVPRSYPGPGTMFGAAMVFAYVAARHAAAGRQPSTAGSSSPRSAR